jgi:hypothetical protein
MAFLAFVIRCFGEAFLGVTQVGSVQEYIPEDDVLKRS